MKRFKTHKRKKKVTHVLLLIILIVSLLLKYYDHNIYDISVDYANSKLEYLTTMYIKKYIVPKNADLNKLIVISKNDKGSILSVDIDSNYAYELTGKVSEQIQSNINELQRGNVSISDNSISKYNNNIFVLVPLFSANNSILLNSLGPKVPIKLDFYEYVLATVETQAKQYGINNVLVEVYLTITFEQKLLFPYKEKKFTRDYKLMLGSKMITGEIPDAYGGIISSQIPVTSQ